MSITGVSITKSVSFRGVQQEFSNVYYYSTPLGAMSVAEATSAVNTIVTAEKTWHSTDVSFVRAKVWSASGSKAENEMIYQTALSGTGSQATNTSLDRERAVLVQWRAGVDTLGRPVRLRKWFHICGAYSNGTQPTTTNMQNTSQINTAIRTDMATKANALKSITAVARNFDLVGPSGRPTSGDAVTHEYLEHHQLGDEWRSV